MKKRIVDIDKSIFEKILPISKNYREVTMGLGISYCSGSITQIRVAAQKHEIDISHLEKRNSKSVEEVESKLRNKWIKRAKIDKKLRAGNSDQYAVFILYDSRSNDKRKGLENNLTIEFVRSKLSIGKCTYCENDKCKLTLDRIDNNKGHTIDNVVVSCNNCNIIRGNIPFDAWTCMVPGVKMARQLGLLDNWSAYNKRFG